MTTQELRVLQGLADWPAAHLDQDDPTARELADWLETDVAHSRLVPILRVRGALRRLRGKRLVAAEPDEHGDVRWWITAQGRKAL